MTPWFDLGDVAVVPLVEIDRLLIEPAEFFPDLPRMDGPYVAQPWFDANTQSLVYRMQAFLVVTPERTILVDGCIGPGKPRRRPEFDQLDRAWLSQLEATGLGRADVEEVLFTHLHVDHVGWATWREEGGQWKPVFTNARHVVTRAELDYWSSTPGSAAMQRTGDYMADSVEPLRLAGLLESVDAPFNVNEQVSLQPAPGHTPGNVAVRVRGSAGELLLVGDVMHHPLQIHRPNLSTRYCVDPEAATRTRTEILDEAAAKETILVPSHFAGTGAFRIRPAQEGYVLTRAHDVIRESDYDVTAWRR